MLDYYSILEINESASKETIEKVHKLLIKKYHPDLQPEENKKEAEEYIKKINEAYEVLTNPEKKKDYDIKLKEYRMQNIIEEMKKSGKIKENNVSSNNTNQQTNQVVNVEQEITQQTNTQQGGPFNISDDEIRRQAQIYYDELYNQYLYRNGYIRDTKQEFRDFIAKVITIVIIIGIVFIIVKIPFTRNLLKDLIAKNEILNMLIGWIFK